VNEDQRVGTNVLSAITNALPRGNTLPHAVWRRRHLFLLGLLWFQTGALFVYALLQGHSVDHGLLEVGLPALLAACAMAVEGRPRFASALVAVGLISTSAVLVHVSGGLIEAHFHFFVMVLILALYEDWIPFLIAIAWVAIHHGIVGELSPASVYNHPEAVEQPWKWAGIHAFFVLAAAGAAVISWRLNEMHRAETEHAMIERHAAEVEAQRAKDEFMGLISHELRTPLTSIIGYADLLVESDSEQLAAQGKQFAEVISRNASRELRLVEDLLDLTRLDAGRFRVEIGEAELPQIVRDAVESARLRAEDKGIEMSAEIEAIPTLAGDPERLAQTCDNLISNAIKFTPEGGTISVGLKLDGEAAVLSVEDSGVGIPADELEKVFERMFRTKKAEHIPGTGLGLAITKAIADAHGGEIAVASEEDEGTTFTLRVPLAPPVAVPHA
jgi:signal transduction histidine kinase